MLPGDGRVINLNMLYLKGDDMLDLTVHMKSPAGRFACPPASISSHPCGAFLVDERLT